MSDVFHRVLIVSIFGVVLGVVVFLATSEFPIDKFCKERGYEGSDSSDTGGPACIRVLNDTIVERRAIEYWDGKFYFVAEAPGA
jgi:hypothetical protein